MTLRNPVESNIWKLNLLQACRWFMLIMPVIVLFYYENGLTMQQVMLLQAIYSLVLVACEIPSGYLRYFGQKKLPCGRVTAGYARLVIVLHDELFLRLSRRRNGPGRRAELHIRHGFRPAL